MTQTIYFDHVNGKVEEVFPCRCGETHRGPQAAYDYAHHNCFHTTPLVRLPTEGDEPEHLMCPQCGKDFWLAAECP